MLSPSGRCKVLDSTADGYVRGESCHAMIVARLMTSVSSASAQAVVLSSAVNQDGRSSSLTAPNGPAQQAVLRAALREASLAPSLLQLLSMHGTGTALGDPIEINSATSVLLSSAERTTPLSLLASKSWHGHTEPNAGLVALEHAMLGSRLQARLTLMHLRQLNPYVEGVLEMLPSSGSCLALARQAAPLPRMSNSNMEGVCSGTSSFAFAGTFGWLVLASGGSTAILAIFY